MRKRWLPLVIVLFAGAVAAAALSWSAVAGAGGPPKPARSGVAGTTIDKATVTQRALSTVQRDGAIDRGGVRAELTTVGADADLNLSVGHRYASDYPVWVVTVTGEFGWPLWASAPADFVPPNYTEEIIYFDGHTGDVIGRGLDGATPGPTRTPRAVRDAPVIDEAAAMQAVMNEARQTIQPGTLSARLTTFAAGPAEFAKKFASAYPVWAVTGDAVPAYWIDGTEPTVMTFYVDGYSGQIIVTAKDLAPTVTPTP